MTLPILVSVPHAGTLIPGELAENFLLTDAQVTRDGDEGAAAIYALESEVRHFVTTDIARAVLDMNRAEDDIRRDGVVKTHSCWEEPLWRESLTPAERSWLIETWHRPYHARLTELANDRVILGVDGHTMNTHGPPVGPDPGSERPEVCLGIGDGTMARGDADHLLACFREAFDGLVTLNDPFSGGWITRSHAQEMPWVQIELSRTSDPALDHKRERVLDALARWCEHRRP